MTTLTATERDMLTWFFLLLIAYGTYRIAHGATMSNRVHNAVPRAGREVRGPIQLANWLMVAEMTFLWLTIQGWVEWGGVVRTLCFTAALITAVLISIFVDIGYTRYWSDLTPLGDSRNTQRNPD